MPELKQKMDKSKVDTKEFEIPETVFIRDIENKVFQSMVLHCLAQIEGIGLTEGNFIDHVLGRSAEGVKGIHAEQDEKNQSVNIRVEVNIAYGVSIPEKADEIQTKVAEEVTKLTGLHVGSVHVVFKNVISSEQHNKGAQSSANSRPQALMGSQLGEEYTDEF